MAFRNLITALIGDVDDLSGLKFKLPTKKQAHVYSERELLDMESKIGAQLFGPVPAGRRREFFCLDEKNWIWYEEWKDETGKMQNTTVRYELHDNGVLKVQPGGRYSYLEGAELDNFMRATNAYYEQVMNAMYQQIPAAA